MNQDLQESLNDKPGLIPRQVMPENLESPVNNVLTWITPNELFYVRTHLTYPTINKQSWRLAIGGEASQPLYFDYEQLQQMPQVDRFVTIECSGNKRALFDPPVPGEQWKIGAVGNVKWTGIPLTFILDQIKPKDTAVEIVFTGADSGIRPDMDTPVNFERSLPMDKGLLGECLLALKMNDEPIPHKHGFPLRLIVPGWYGMAHVKWVNQINLIANPFQGPFQAIDYVYLTNEGDYSNAVPVREMRVNSIITWPSQGEIIHPGQHSLRGLAWTGKGTISKVEVSVDNGMTWNVAQLTSPEHQQYTWTFWEYAWNITNPGHYFVLVRAYDSNGNVQPKAAPWNAKGYGNNSIRPVGLLTIKWAAFQGAKRIIAVDYIKYRLEHAEKYGAEVINFEEHDNTGEYIKEITRGGADVVIDCVGMDGKMTAFEKIETVLKLQGGSKSAIEMAAQAVRKGGTVSLVGVYGARYNMFPLGDFFARNITLKMGQCPAHSYVERILNLIKEGRFDATDIITHKLALDRGEHAYEIFDKKQDNCIKVVLKP